MSAARKLRHFATPASDSVSRPRSTGYSCIADRTRNMVIERLTAALENSARFPALCSRPPGSRSDPYFAPSSKPSFNY
jgi:hypothetical protein